MTHFWDKVHIVHLSFKWENYLNSFSNKTVTISMDRQQKNGLNVIPFVFFNNTIIVARGSMVPRYLMFNVCVT